MDNNGTDYEQPTINDRFNPFFSMWLQPRYTMRRILDGKRGPVILLAALGGIADALARISERNGDGINTLIGVISMATFSGIIGGIIGIYILSALLKFTGKWIGGRGTYEDVLTAVAWSNVPTIWSLPVWAMGMFIFGIDFFKDASLILQASMFLNIISWILSIIFMLLGIWSIFISIKCVAEAQQFSSWKALLNFILSFVIVIVPIILILAVSLIH